MAHQLPLPLEWLCTHGAGYCQHPDCKPAYVPTRVLILDQFSGPSPYHLSKSPMRFEDLVTEMMAEPPRMFRTCRLEYVTDDYSPAMATSVWRADGRGNAELWKYRWDTSG